MSKTHHIVFHDIKSMSVDELEDHYTIEIKDDGTVWDPLEGMEFKDLNTWAIYTAEQDQDVNFGHKTKITKPADFDE